MTNSSQHKWFGVVEAKNSYPAVYVASWVVFWIAIHLLVFAFMGEDLWRALWQGALGGFVFAVVMFYFRSWE